uniref:Uncharacterized protein n=2 Tax=Tetraselmis sp. GSL018 TaxID=582737 RepID=A0A061SC51_9CHLO
MGTAASTQNSEQHKGNSVVPVQQTQKNKSKQLDDELGYDRPALKRGQTFAARLEKLQGGLAGNREQIQQITDDSGNRAKLAMAQENLAKLRRVMQTYRAEGKYGSIEYNQKNEEYKKVQRDVEQLKRKVQMEDMKQNRAHRIEQRQRQRQRQRQGQGQGGAAGKQPQRGQQGAEGFRRAPTWRINVARAKDNFKSNWRGFIMVKKQADEAFAKGQKEGQYMHIEDLSTQGILVFQSLGDRTDYFIKLHKLFIKKEAEHAEAQTRGRKLPPLSKEGESAVRQVVVGPNWLWRKDRVPLCLPMLVLAVDSREKRPDAASSSQAAVPAEEPGEDAPELTPRLADGIDNQNKLETWVKQHEIPVDQNATLQDIGNTLQMVINRANSQHITQPKVFMPAVQDIAAFAHAGGLDAGAYLSEVGGLVRAGRLAIQVIGTETLAVYPDRSTVGLLNAEPWQICEEAAPGQVPSCEKLMGLTFLRRIMIRLSLAVKALGGDQGLHATMVLLHLRSDELEVAARELSRNAFFGFGRENVHIVPAREERGFVWSDEGRAFVIDNRSPKTTPGDGFAIQQLMVPYEALSFSSGGDTERRKTTMMSLMKAKRVQWLHTFHTNDLKALQRGGTLDPVALSMAIREQKTHGANIGIEVMDVATITEMQFCGSVLLSAADDPSARGNPTHRCALHKVHECLSPEIIAKLEQLRRRSSGKLLTGLNRYYFYLPELAGILRQPGLFKPTLEMAGAAVYPRRFMMDLTSAEEASCFALKSRTSMPPTLARPFWWSRETGVTLKEMDQDPSVRAAVGTYIRDMSAALEPPKKEDRYEKCKKKKLVDQPRVIVFFVIENQASRKAFSLVSSILQSTISSRDHWHVVTSVREQHNERAAADLLNTFADDTLGGLNLTRRVLVRGDAKLHDTLEDYANKVGAKLLVFGSSNLTLGQGSRRLGSVTLTALKSMTMPILVVKDNAKRTELKQYLSYHRNKIRACTHVTPTAGKLVEFVGSLLDHKHRRDIMVLARPDAFNDEKPGEKTSAKFVLDHFTNVVREMDLHPVAKPLYGHPQDCLPNAAEAVEAHLLAVQGPQGRCLPEWIAKVVQSTKCSLLVYKDTEPTIL